MTGNHWTVFNSGGAVVCDNMPLEVVSAYMTPERFARGWKAVFCLIVNSEEHLAELTGDITERQMQDEEQPDDEAKCPACDGDGGDKWNDYALPCPECGGDGRLW